MDKGILTRVCRYGVRPVAALAATLLLLAGVCPLGAREQVVIQKGTSGNTQLRAADSWIDGTAGNQGTNHGASATLQVQSRTNQAQRTVVLFDLSIVPNAGIKTATLTLNMVSAPSNARTYSANLVTSFWNEPDVTWLNRVATTPWGAAGGDFDNTVTVNAAIPTAVAPVSWNVTTMLQTWYNGTPNYGFLIKDNTEGGGTTRTTQFSSKEDATAANRPKLTLTFLQNVANLTATAGNNAITLNWAYPTPIPAAQGGSILEPYAGVVILRRATAPVDKASFPADGAAPPALCSTVGTGEVVFVGTLANMSFTDNSTNNTCAGAGGAPANGTFYYYKVFTYDTKNHYSSNPAGLPAPRDGGSVFTAEAGAMPNPPGTTEALLWMIATHSAVQAAPGIEPGSQIDIGTDTNQLFALDSTTGAHVYPPVSLGGIITGRPPILDASITSIGKQVAYVAAQDNYVYAIDTTTGAILWLSDPNGSTTNLFQGGAAVQLKSLSGAAYTFANDLVVVGTRNGGTTSGNSILGLDGNAGTVQWTHNGTPGATTALDIISSTPTIDYTNNAIWLTSHANGGAGQPNLWRINPLNGAVIFSGNFNGIDIDSSPTLTFNADVLFVGTNGVTAPPASVIDGRLYAINPKASSVAPVVSPAVQGAVVAFYDDGNDGSVVGFPFVTTTVPPYTVIYTTNTKVHAVSFDPTTNTFTRLWTTTIFAAPFPTCNAGVCSLSAPVVAASVNMVYAGGSDGFLYELNLSTGALVKKVVVDTNYPAVVGDPALDVTNQRVYVSTTTNDQRSYAIAIPF
jgi:PQQ-like domain